MIKPSHILLATVCATLLSLAPCFAQEGPQSDRERLRSVEFEGPREDGHYPYGLQPNRHTLSPLYHLTSAGLYVWQNDIAPEVTTRGGYADTNEEYFKALVEEYGGVRAFFYSFDRLVRNTRIGRHTSPKNKRGLVEDRVERYRSHRKSNPIKANGDD